MQISVGIFMVSSSLKTEQKPSQEGLISVTRGVNKKCALTCLNQICLFLDEPYADLLVC